MLLRLLTVALAALLTAPAATTALWLPQAISSNMVLQRAPQQARLWGSAAPASTVTVTLDSTAYKVYAQADGSWTVDFPPQPASTARTITIAGDSTAVTLSNVAFGDVYICSGQSNMEFAVADSFDAKTAIPDSANYPHLRLFTIAEVASLTPVNDTINRWQAQTNGTRWAVSGPAYVAGPSFDYFSATCYYFGRAVYRAVNPAGGDAAAVVPIGLIDTCWGGTRIEAWTTPAGLAQCGPVQGVDEYLATTPDTPAYRAHTRGSQQQQQQQQRLDGDSPHSLAMRRAASKALLGKRSAAAAELEAGAAPSPQTPSVLFNGMIAPIAQMRVRGATWYQGEANVGNATNYACRFPAMIEDWRTIYPNLAFYFVLLAAYKEGGYPDWPLIRDAQLAALRLPYVGVGSAQDLGDEASPQGAIHPRNKTWVGERLAVNALADIYHQNIVKVGPSPYDIVWPVAGQPTQSVILRFDSSRPENRGLGLLDTSQCDVCCRGLNGSAITVYTSGGARLRASVVVAAPDTVVATVSGLGGNDSVVSVQHNWEEYPQCALYNAARIPALPFNTRKP